MKLHSLLTIALAAAGTIANAGTTTFIFDGNLDALEAGRPSLSAVDPGGTNAFGSATLYGESHSIYTTSGSTDTTGQAGLTLDDSSLISTASYSLEMVLSMENVTGFRRIFNAHSRFASDQGLYAIDGSLRMYPGASAGSFPANVFHYVALTVNGGFSRLYLNGAEVSAVGSTMFTDNAFTFFLDDGLEYSNASVGLIRITDKVLTGSDIAARAANPYNPVPEPASMAVLGLGLAALKRRRRSRKSSLI